MGRVVREETLPLTRDDVLAVSEWNNDPDWMREKRLQAWDIAEGFPIPTTSEEPWRRTNISRLKWEKITHYEQANDVSLKDVPEELTKPLIGEQQGGLLVFVDGVLVHSEINGEIEKQGVIFTDLASASQEHANLVQKHFMTDVVSVEEGKFSALHGALWTHGTFLYVPKGVHVELPFHSVEYVQGERTTSTHIFARLEENSSATYLHESASPNLEERTLHLGAVELSAGDNANLRFVKLQNWGENVINFGHQRGRVGRNGQLDWIASEMGTRLSKVFQTLDLDGDDAWGRISGFYFPDKRQHIDLDTQQNHHALRTTSDLLYKGALKGKSHSVWQGMILVDPGAQQTDGFQANRNLILERTARGDSIPGLEIQADDVRCTHAATAGKMDETEIFYLMSRGISREIAEHMIVQGFFDPIMQRIPFEEIRDRLTDYVELKLFGEKIGIRV